MVAMAANQLFIPDDDTRGVVNGFTVTTGFTWLFAVRAGQWIFHSSQSDASACVQGSPRDGSLSDVHCLDGVAPVQYSCCSLDGMLQCTTSLFQT
jgi:hypothetical protein